MKYQKLFKSGFIRQLEKEINNGEALGRYCEGDFPYQEDVVLTNPTISVGKEIHLKKPDRNSTFEFENAKSLFSAYKGMTPVQATDARIWTYMTHVTFWDYMQRRWPLDGKSESELKKYLLAHWFIEKVNAKSLSRHGIASLWWGAYLTYDEDREDPFGLTREFFSYLEYRRELLEGTLGRSKNFMHAFLEFVIENGNLFEQNKENRIRFLTKRVNFVAGHRVLSVLSKNEIKEILGNYKNALVEVKGREDV